MSGDYQGSKAFKDLLPQLGSVILVVDDSPTMLPFVKKFRELRDWLKQSGAALSVYSLSASENSEVQLNRLPDSGHSLLGEACNELPAPEDGSQSLILFFSDFTTPDWRDGHYNPILRKWVDEGHFLTLIPTFPQEFWLRTALSSWEAVYLHAKNPDDPLSDWQVNPLEGNVSNGYTIPNYTTHTIIPLFNLTEGFLDHLSRVLRGDPKDELEGILSYCLPQQQQEKQKDEEQDFSDPVLQQLEWFRFSSSPKAGILLKELLRATQDSIMPYQTIEEMQETLFGEIDPIVTHQIICSGLFDCAKFLSNDDNDDNIPLWGRNLNLDTDPRTLAFPIPEKEKILKAFGGGIAITLKPEEGTQDQRRHDWRRHYNTFLLNRARDTNFEKPTVLHIEQGRSTGEAIQMAQLPDFVLEVLSKKGPEFLQECRNNTTNRRGGGRGYGTIPVFPNLSIQTPPIDNDDLFWSSIREQISDFNKRTFWEALNEAGPQDVLKAWQKHMSRGEMG